MLFISQCKVQNCSLIVPLNSRPKVFTTTEETQPMSEVYTEASTDVFQETTEQPPEVITEIYTEIYTDVYTEKYTEVFTERPEIYTEIYTDVYPDYTDIYEDTYQNEYRDQPVTKGTVEDRKVTPLNRETAKKQDKKDTVHQNGPDPLKGTMSKYLTRVIVAPHLGVLVIAMQCGVFL